MKADDPRMTNVVCAIAQIGYEHGKNGIEIAEQWIESCVHALVTVRDGRARDPKSFPGYGEATAEETARRIVARLLDAGWRPPDTECLEVSAELLNGGE